MAPSCGWCTVVSFTTRGIYDGITQSFIYRSADQLLLRRLAWPFTWHPYAQLKGIIVIAGCICTHWKNVVLVSNDIYQVSILRQYLESFKILTKTDPVYRGWWYTTSLKDYGMYLHTHIKSTGRIRYEHFTEKDIHRVSAAYIRILLIWKVKHPKMNSRNKTCQNHLVEHFHKISKRYNYIIAAQV